MKDGQVLKSQPDSDLDIIHKYSMSEQVRDHIHIRLFFFSLNNAHLHFKNAYTLG